MQELLEIVLAQRRRTTMSEEKKYTFGPMPTPVKSVGAAVKALQDKQLAHGLKSIDAVGFNAVKKALPPHIKALNPNKVKFTKHGVVVFNGEGLSMPSSLIDALNKSGKKK
jgi:hypothetical protein